MTTKIRVYKRSTGWRVRHDDCGLPVYRDTVTGPPPADWNPDRRTVPQSVHLRVACDGRTALRDAREHAELHRVYQQGHRP